MLWRGHKQLFREHWALSDISFELYSGETLGIIGCNGSGKSTLLQIICGTLTPTSGEVLTEGRVAALLELGAGFNPEFTGIENVFLSGQLYGMSTSEVREKLESIVDFSGIGDYVSQPVKTYSSGMFVRLAFSVVAHLEPKILIVDEALSVGDFVFQQKCAKLMKDKLSGVTKIIVSHDLSAISNMADRVLVLHKGKKVFIGDTQTGLAVYQKAARDSIEGRETFTERPNQPPEPFHSNSESAWQNVDSSILSGSGGATILKFRWAVEGLASARTIKKTERLVIEFIIEAKNFIDQPIFGYQVQDRFGNPIFGENTESSNFEVTALRPGLYQAQVEVLWPQIESGEYSVTLGIGNGENPTSHTIECWAHNIVILSNVSAEPKHGIFNNKLKNFIINGI